MDLLPLISSFWIIAIAELGDKTQLTVVCLSANRRAKAVFIGAVLAFALVDGISALVGGMIAAFLPTQSVGVGAGVAFLVFGAYSFFQKSEEADVDSHHLGLARSFTLVALMELGDKTQFAVIALAAEYDAPFMVFFGVMLALIFLTAVGIMVGGMISRFVPLRYVKIGSGIVFIVCGALFLWSATTGTKLL